MSNRRVKSMAYDDDDGYDDYEEDYEEGGTSLTPEDREQLRLGTIEVRKALGTSVPATDDEIQEALWHYYYDIAKCVLFIKNKHTAPAPKASQKSTLAMKADLPSSSRPFSAAGFFRDCPWFNIPSHRRAEILIVPLCPSTGLLGGSSKDIKVSKLAALAAKRRKKEDTKPTEIRNDPKSVGEDAAKSLSALKITPEQVKQHGHAPQATIASNLNAPIVPAPIPTIEAECFKPSEPQHNPYISNRDDDGVAFIAQIRARPSLFARTILGNSGPENEHLLPFSALGNNSDAKSFDFTEPSPDDVVTRAQNTKAMNTSKPKQKDTARNKIDVTTGVGDLSIKEPVKIKSKNIDVTAEYTKFMRKNAANFVVIGHVDAGKSTLMGRLLFDLKAVDQRTMDKYKKEAERIGKGSFAFAWVLDQGTEERARGVTIDIATNRFETDKTSFTILDAPGHRDFVPNMIAGASQADFAVLVIDASTGNFESGLKGQTKEHALLVRSIGVQRIIVAVNKMDTADWSEERFQEIQQQMSGFLTSAGFQPKNVAFVPCSGLEGGNILLKTTDKRASWYKGHTLVQELDMSEPTTYALDKPLRMTVGDVFRGGVQNPLSVSGRLEAGNIQIGEQIVIVPSGEKAFVKSLEVDDEPEEWAVAGQNVVLHLTDIDAIHLKIGDVLCSPSSPIQNITRFKAKLLAFEHLTPMNVDIHRGRLHIPGRITQLIASLDKSTGGVVKKKPKIVPPGSVVRVVVELEQPVPLESPGRIVLRAGGETVAAGLIE